MSEMSEQGIKEAFDAYRAEPGGEVRLDTATITASGRRRVRRNQALIGAAGLGVVATLVGAAVVVPQLGDGDRPLTVADGAATELPPTTGRDLKELFGEAPGWSSDADAKAGGVARDAAAKFLGTLGGTAPTGLDTAWQPLAGESAPGARWALVTWANGGKAAEGLLSIDPNPVSILIHPAPYQVCGANETSGGKTCTVKQVAGKGWLKETRETRDGTQVLRVSLHTEKNASISFLLSQGAATKSALAAGKQPMGQFPVAAETVGKAVLGMP